MNARVHLASRSGAPSADLVKSALERLLSGGKLKLSERNRRFLSFVVLEALAGRGERIKAYTIAVDVFGRGSDFDPTHDPIVRIEATRLRSALSAYYEHMEPDEQVRILIPPGAYVPHFSWVDRGGGEDAKPSELEPAKDVGPCVILDTQADKTDCLVKTRIALLLASIVARLKNSRLRLFLASSREGGAAVKAMNRILNGSEPVYACDISVHAVSDSFRYCWVFTDVGTGEIIGSEIMDRSERAIELPAVDEIAERLAHTIRSALNRNH
jgi:hypothetical protein